MIVIVNVLSAHLLKPSSLDITASCRDYTSAWSLRTLEQNMDKGLICEGEERGRPTE